MNRLDRPSPRQYAPPPLSGGCSVGEALRALSDLRALQFEQSRRTVFGRVPPFAYTPPKESQR